MHIVIDARKFRDGGIGTYIRNLVDGFSSSPQHKLTVIAKPDDATQFSQSVEVIEDTSRPYSVSEYIVMPLRLREVIAKADIYHSPHFTLPYFLTAPSVVTIHDTILLTYPRRSIDAHIAKRLVVSALKRADRVITVSDTSRAKLARLLPAAAEKLRVIPNALSPHIGKLAASESGSDSYFVFIGSERSHKGFNRLLEAWKILRRNRGAGCPKLIVVGTEFNLSKKSIVGTDLETVITFKDSVSDVELERIMRRALFLLMPSYDEGFGLPMLEALALGTPAICSDIPVFRELFFSGAIFVNDREGEGFADTIDTVLENTEARDQLSRAGRELSQRYTLAETTAKTLAVYQECLR